MPFSCFSGESCSLLLNKGNRFQSCKRVLKCVWCRSLSLISSQTQHIEIYVCILSTLPMLIAKQCSIFDWYSGHSSSKVFCCGKLKFTFEAVWALEMLVERCTTQKNHTSSTRKIGLFATLYLNCIKMMWKSSFISRNVIIHRHRHILIAG